MVAPPPGAQVHAPRAAAAVAAPNLAAAVTVLVSFRAFVDDAVVEQLLSLTFVAEV